MYKNDDGIVQAMRNLPGVTLLPVDQLNLLKLAPGGHVGRFTIYTQNAFEALDQVYSKDNKKGFAMPRSIVTNPDLQRILQADEVKAALKPRGKATKRSTVKKNPLKNIKAMLKLNPYAAVEKRAGWKRANTAQNEDNEDMEVTIVDKQDMKAAPVEKSPPISEKSDEIKEENEEMEDIEFATTDEIVLKCVESPVTDVESSTGIRSWL